MQFYVKKHGCLIGSKGSMFHLHISLIQRISTVSPISSSYITYLKVSHRREVSQFSKFSVKLQKFLLRTWWNKKWCMQNLFHKYPCDSITVKLFYFKHFVIFLQDHCIVVIYIQITITKDVSHVIMYVFHYNLSKISINHTLQLWM